MVAPNAGREIELMRRVTAAACASAWEMVNPGVTTQIDLTVSGFTTPLVNIGAPQLLTGTGRISGMES